MSSLEQISLGYRRLNNSIDSILRTKFWNPEIIEQDVKKLGLTAWDAKKMVLNCIAAHKLEKKPVPNELLNIKRISETIFNLHYKSEDYLIWSARNRGIFTSNMNHKKAYRYY
jgi:hypothetical protein